MPTDEITIEMLRELKADLARFERALRKLGVIILLSNDYNGVIPADAPRKEG